MISFYVLLVTDTSTYTLSHTHTEFIRFEHLKIQVTKITHVVLTESLSKQILHMGLLGFNETLSTLEP